MEDALVALLAISKSDLEYNKRKSKTEYNYIIINSISSLWSQVAESPMDLWLIKLLAVDMSNFPEQGGWRGTKPGAATSHPH